MENCYEEEMNNLSPIILFVYNRPWHTAQTVEALKNNELASESALFVFADGPKVENDEDVQKVREFIKTVNGFKSVTIVEREKNIGLAESVITGVTEIVNEYGRVIVLEDDLITSKYFLRFMNDGLDTYENEEKVISIHGYLFPVRRKSKTPFFMKGSSCLGWATWRRGWALFNPDGKALLEQIKKQNLENEFDFYGSYPYTAMMTDHVNGKNNSWAIRWYASAFLNNKLTLWPNRSLVFHLWKKGIKGSNCEMTPYLDTKLSNTMIPVADIPVEEDLNMKKAIAENISKHGQEPLIRMIFNFIVKLTSRSL